MSLHGWIALGTLLAAAVLFLTRWLRLEYVALGIPVVLYATRTVPEAEVALRGFGSHAVVALASVFVLGAGLQESGVAALLSRGMARLGGGSEGRLVAVVCLAAASLSAFMMNAAVVAVLLPAVLHLGRRQGVPAPRLLMPLAFSATLGGMVTQVGTVPNLLVSEYLQRATGRGFGVFDFAVGGLPVALAGILFLVLLGRRGLPSGRREEGGGARRPEHLVPLYELDQSLTRLRVGRSSRLRGQSLREAALGERYGLTVLLVVRPTALGNRFLKPTPGLVLMRGDDLYVEGPPEAVVRLAEEERTRLGLPGAEHVERVLEYGVSLAEVAVTPRSLLAGRTLEEADFRGRYGLSVLALWRGGETRREKVTATPLETGDILLVAGPVDRIRAVRESEDLLLLTRQDEQFDASRAPLALLFLGLAVLPPLANGIPLAMSALAAALGMAATGCVSPAGVRRAMDWRVLALVVGTLPLGVALERHGVAAAAGDLLQGAAGSFGGPALLSCLFLLAAAVSITSSNAAAAVVLSPVAARLAEVAGLDLHDALLAVAYGCSCAFLVPFAHQVNLMVQTPGGYTTRDFLRVGGGLTAVAVTVAIAVLSLL